ncbi:outer membrane lipoprotein chaperone LolA [Ignatzschineria cameli]|uniref:Outer-membrane lipoprotein carrier protein n=1 Tax=Ignatzschineria cameli TaxID=2182793 RepID=A0A2U2ALE3_9GAMM|nr:outer membrane lipoprotein chaperone LolA [Ignatzschineria cameli]PWD83619.1 outer membrane lipoprotein carrier protein LolA [Ignatzschineria cameli]PWD84015.1 outer membrane lipoprotein carrier protein LolA [Ignatzschineria cameli]
MTKRFLQWFFPLTLLLTPAMTLANQQFIVDYFQNLKTLEANFTQEIITKDRVDTTTGELIIEKNNPTVEGNSQQLSSTKGQKRGISSPKFLFDYQKPYQQILVSNGEKFWFYDVDLMQVIIKPLSEVLNNPVLQILLSAEPLDQYFDIKMVRDRREYLLTPKVGRSDLEVKDIQVIFANRKIYSFKVEDVTGQKISFVMKRVQENSTIPASRFDFTIPADVDVIDETKK